MPTAMLESHTGYENTPHTRRIVPVVLLLILLSIIAVIGTALVRQNAEQVDSGQAPDFTVTTFDGENITLSGLQGQVVVVNFWASWCVPCRDEAPIFQQLWEDYRNDDVVLIGLAYADTERDALAFIAEFGITYPNGIDVGTRIYDRYNAQGVPETFIVSKDGQVARFIYGPITESVDIKATIEELILEGNG